MIINVILFLLIGFTPLFILFAKIDKRLFYLTSLIVIVKFALVLIDNFHPFIPYDGDISAFEATSIKILNEFLVGNFYPSYQNIPSSASVFPYSYLNAMIMYIFGNSFIFPRFFNIFLSSFFTIFLYKLSLRFIKKDQSYRLFLVFSIMPSYFLLSIVLMRDTLNNLIFLFFFYLFIEFLYKKNPSSLFILFFLLFLSSFLRELNPLLILIGIFLFFTVSFIEKFFKFLKFRYYYFLITFFLLFLFVGEFTSFGNSLRDYLLDELNYRASGGAQYLFLIINNLTDLIFISPWLYVNFLFYPLLHNVTNIFSFVFFIEGSYYLIYFCNFIFFISRKSEVSKYTYKLNTFLFIFSMFLILSYFSSLIVANGGTALRQRTFFIFLLPIISLTIKNYFPGHKNSKINFF